MTNWPRPLGRISPFAGVLLALGAALLWAATRLDAAWFDAHILPNFFLTRETQWAIAQGVRSGLALAGYATLLFALPFIIGRKKGPGLWTICAVTVAGLAAILTSEAALHISKWHALQARQLLSEPQRRPDPRLGWTHLPKHVGRAYVGGRWIDYAFDNHGYRVRDAATTTDVMAPSILFAGESVMLGDGLEWQETIPARVGADIGMQTVNLAVTGYSTDQSLMRLRTDLPRFSCPRGIVTIFMPSFLGRNLNTDRPHLDRRLNWHAPAIGSRLGGLLRYASGYGGATSIDNGIAMTRAALNAAGTLADTRGAWALTVVPVFMPESAAERSIRHNVLDGAGLDYLVVPLDPRTRIANNGHPDARAAALIASAIVTRFHREARMEPPPCRPS